MADGQTNGALVKAPINAGGQVSAILANSFDDAWRIGGVMAASGMTSFKRQEEACAAIMAGGEVGLPPFAALQSFMFVNGRLSMWGDAQLALVRAAGHKVEEWYEGSLADGTLKAFTKVTRCDTGEVIQADFDIDAAKRAGLWQTNARVKRRNKQTNEWYEVDNDSPWYRYQPRMLKYRARGFSLRDGCSDVLRGIKMVEEVRDYPDEPVEARIVDHTGDNDQRPTEERDPRIGKFGVIGGQTGKDVFDDLAQRMSETEDGAALEEVWAEAERTPLSQNRMGALAEHYEAVKLAHEENLPIPVAPRFTEAPEPSPFEALKKQGEAVAAARALSVFASALTPEVLGRCSEAEREELRAIYRAKKSNPARSAAGKTDEDAGKASNGDAAPGGTGSSASSSPFEKLKADGLAVLQLNGARRKRSHYASWLEGLCIGKPKCSPLEQGELDMLETTISKEISA